MSPHDDPRDGRLPASDAPLPGTPLAEAPVESCEDTPEIGPPLLLEPIPEPVVTARRAPAPTMLPVPGVSEEQVEDDPYAWASQAASAMEREGRVFDTGAFEAPSADPELHGLAVDEPPAAPAHDTWDTPPARLPARDRSGSTAATAPEVGASTVSWPVLGVATAVVGFLVTVIAIVAIVAGPSAEPEPLLKPVTAALGGGSSAPSLPYARPPADLPIPPGARSGFRASAPQKATPDRAAAGALRGVEIRSTPAGATVRVDGRRLGVTPLVAELDDGDHELELTRPGYQDSSRTLTIEPGLEQVELVLRPNSAPGRVKVQAAGWEGGRLIIDGRVAGLVPTIVELSPGEHHFVVQVGRKQLDVARTVTTDPDQILSIDLVEASAGPGQLSQ